MKEYKVYHIVLIFLLGVLVNFVGRYIANVGGLPLWMDSIGTVLVAYLLGPIVGGMVGLTSNIMYGYLDATSYYYLSINVIIGVLVGFLAKKKFFETLFKAFSLGMILSLIASIFSTIINISLFAGMTGNIWGDAVIQYLKEMGFVEIGCFFLGEFCVDIIDKLVSVVLIYLVMKYHKIIKKARKAATVTTLAVLAIFWYGKTTVVYAQDEPDFSTFIQTVYDDKNGIFGGEVNSISQTQDGMIWIGTYGGLYQYDGNHFNFKNEFNSIRNVNCLYTDEEGRLWVGTNDNGFSICTNAEVVNVIDESSGLSANSVRSIVKNSDGYYYIGTAGALDIVKLSDGVIVEKVFPDINYVSKLTANSNGYVCSIDSQGGLALFKGKSLLDKVDVDENGDKYTTAYFDDEGYLHTATTGQKIVKYEIKDNKIVKIKEKSCEKLTNVNVLYKNEAGVLFICSDNGIGCITDTDDFRYINTNGFDSSVVDMLVDYQGNYWFASARLGLLELCESIFEEVYYSAGLEGRVVNSIVKWNDLYYCGTDSGLDIITANKKNHIKNEYTELLSDMRIRNMLVDTNNNLWVCTSGKGVFKITSDGNVVSFGVADGLIENKTRCMIQTDSNTFYIATDSGISVLENDKFVKKYNVDNGLKISKTLCLYKHGDVIYAGSDGGGIAIIKDGEVKDIIRRANGLSSDIILRMVETYDKKGMFVITSNGLNYLSYEGEVKQLNNFTYFNNFDMIRSKDDKMWITSSAGIFLVDEKQLLSSENMDYELLDSKKGLRQSMVANSWNLIEDDNILLCGDSGIVSIDINKYNNLHASYRIVLDSMILDGVNVMIDKEEANKIGRNVSRVEFLPKVINYSSSDPYVSIWLEGVDKEPMIVLQSQLENISYMNLKAGTYNLHIAILDSKQSDIVEKITYTFIKEKAMYDNWWFSFYLIFILGIVISYLVWLLVGTQINKSLQIQRKEIENMRLRQTADAAVAAGEAKDKFLALMSHDIRTPINAIIGMNEMILRESKEKSIYNYALDIKSAGNTLLSLVNEILDFSKLENGKMELIPVEYETSKLLKNLITGTKGRIDSKNIEFKTDIDTNLPSVLYGDDIRLTQVISNLLTNAVKYTEKGSVTFTYKQYSKTDDEVEIYCEVKDTGIGIRQEDMSKLFDSFQRLDEQRNRNVEGTGLGMSIVISLLKLMDSKLQVESVYGEGSKFSFFIKQKIVSEKPMGDLEVENRKSEEKQKKEHVITKDADVLVVDDNNMNLKVATALLKINKIQADNADSGAMAIEMIKKKHYDMIFMDHMMPEMDGIETLAKIKKKGLLDSSTKVIILTANAINGAKEQYLKEGFDDYLSKPINATLLEKHLLKYLPEEKIVKEQEGE